MNGLLGNRSRLLILSFFLLLALLPSAAMSASDKNPNETLPEDSYLAPRRSSPRLLTSNLDIYSKDMWLVLRYDVQSNSLIAAGSDKDGAALWYAKQVDVSEDSSHQSVTLTARTVLKSGSSVWVDWQDFQIEIDSLNNAVITKTNPNGTEVYEGKSVKIKTFTGGDK